MKIRKINLELFPGFSIPTDEDKNFWMNLGDKDLENTKKIFANLNENKAKNIVLMIGDGMSLGTSVAGRIFIGQEHKGQSGEEYMTASDEMPHVGIVKTYSGI